MSEKFAQAIVTPEDLLSALGYVAEVDGTTADTSGENDDDDEIPFPNTEYYRGTKCTIRAFERAKFNWPKRIVWGGWAITEDATWSHYFVTSAPKNRRRILCQSNAIVSTEPFPAPIDLDELDDAIQDEIEVGAKTMLGGPDEWVMIESQSKEGVKRIASGTFAEVFAEFITAHDDDNGASIAAFVAKLTPADREFRVKFGEAQYQREVKRREKLHQQKLADMAAVQQRQAAYFN